MFLTKMAAKKIVTIAETEKLPKLIRVGCKGGGCSGFRYDLHFEEEDDIKENDNIFESNGIKIIVDDISLQFLENTTIDYMENLMQSGFKFDNPSITAKCGCGMSFNA